MTLNQFHNGLRLIYSIDAHEIGNPPWYRRFRDDPLRFFISCDDETAALIWSAMEKRMPAALAAERACAAIKKTTGETS